MIHVCSLARLHETVEGIGARHIISLVAQDDRVQRPACVSVENHLWLRVHDISAPMDGYVHPDTEHIERLLSFVRGWDQSTPMVVHCYAGISRSTAAAYVSVCALSPGRDELAIAQALRLASPTALPNIRIVTLADGLLGRDGRMISAIEAIGRGEPAAEGEPFRLDLV
jgi:predicted protein tyrosine phosphatase